MESVSIAVAVLAVIYVAYLIYKYIKKADQERKEREQASAKQVADMLTLRAERRARERESNIGERRSGNGNYEPNKSYNNFSDEQPRQTQEIYPYLVQSSEEGFVIPTEKTAEDWTSEGKANHGFSEPTHNTHHDERDFGGGSFSGAGAGSDYESDRHSNNYEPDTDTSTNESYSNDTNDD